MQFNVNIESLSAVTKQNQLQLNPLWKNLCLASPEAMCLLQENGKYSAVENIRGLFTRELRADDHSGPF